MAMQDTKRAVRVNVEIVYDDGTLEEASFNDPFLWDECPRDYNESKVLTARKKQHPSTIADVQLRLEW